MFLSVLKHMLAERGLRVSEKTAAEFYEYMMKAAQWFPQEGTLSLSDWKRLGKDLKWYATTHENEPVPRQMFPIWLQIRDALTDKTDLELLAEEVQSVKEQECHPIAPTTVGGYGATGPAEVTHAEIQDDDDWGLEDEARKYEEEMYPDDRDHRDLNTVALPAFPLKGKAPLPVPKSRRKLLPPVGFQAAVKEARQTGDLSLICPIVTISEFDDDSQWEPLPLKILKELQTAVRTSGPSAPFTLQIVDLVASQWMTPSDWHQTARSTLSPGDYVLWRTEYEERCKVSLKKNLVGGGKKGAKQPTLEMMLGTGDYIDQQSQVRIPKQVLKEITANAVLAWRAIPPPGIKGTTLSGIRQQMEESYQTFISRLEEAINRMMPPSEGTEILLKQLAWENANTLCQDLIRPIRKAGTLQDYIKACLDASPAVVQGMAYAAAVQGQPINKFIKKTYGGGQKSSTCFGCGQTGHARNECPKNRGLRNPKSKQPPGICPRCEKGRHWKNECKSKFHKDGTPLVKEEIGNTKN